LYRFHKNKLKQLKTTENMLNQRKNIWKIRL
jgi:hypothetical protein